MHILLLAFIIHIVHKGDTLWGISPGHRWEAVCQYNHVKNCDLIYPGERIVVNVPASYAARHSHTGPVGGGDRDSDGVGTNTGVVGTAGRVSGGTLSCTGLERLWEAAGGNPGSAFVAAEIAMAESGGKQYARGPVGERGYWQIHPDHGALSTYDAFGNARAAVIISGNGSNWSPWTTYTSGAYQGRCLRLRRERIEATWRARVHHSLSRARELYSCGPG